MTQKVLRIKKYLFPRLLGFIICSSIAFTAKGQTATKPTLKVDGDKLIIEYSIVDSNSSDRFLINVIITDDDGNIINTNSLTGDIGANIKGGVNQIEWEFGKDDIVYETTINVKIGYEKLNQQTEEPPPIPVSSTKSYSRAGLIIQSVAFPGLGMTKLKGKPYWIYGIAGYGLGGYSLFNYFYNIQSVYRDYKNGIASGNDYKYAWDKYINITIYTACGAGAIWLTDIVLVSIFSKSVNQHGFNKFNISPGYDYRTRSPLLTMTYKF